MPHPTEVPVFPVAARVFVSVQDWQISLELIIHEEIPHLDSLLTALHGKMVQATIVSSEERNTANTTELPERGMPCLLHLNAVV